MARRTDDIQQEIADTQRHIEDTRLAMTEKLELLGERVQETVEGAQASVEGLVENVKDTVDTTVATVKQTVEGAQASVERVVENVKGTVTDTVTTVKHTFDISYQVEHHPWRMVGGATLVGYLLGSRKGSRPSAAFSTPSSELSAPPPPPQGMVSGVLEQFKDEIALIKSAAVGAMMSTLWGMVKQIPLPAAPPMQRDKPKGGAQSSERPAQTPAARSSPAINGSAIF
jgi:ElaB/YqjD/DUF883 family membrane-anchored ribosome-binding protein